MSYNNNNNEYGSNNNDEYSSTVCSSSTSLISTELHTKLCGPIISAINTPLFPCQSPHFFQAFVSNSLICRVAKVVSMTEPLAQVLTV
jgi:hypothetical protein